MKTLYIECSMGAAGDMLMAALYELLDDRQAFLDTMNALGLPGVRVEAQAAAQGRSMEGMTLEELDKLWECAKET